jgi:prophage regulatory protein
METKKFLRAKEVAQMLGIGISTVWYYVKIGNLPEPIRLGKRVTVWKLSDLNEWMEERIGQGEERA